MFDFRAFGRLLRAFKDAVANKDFTAVIKVVPDIVSLLGFDPEAKEVREIIACAEAGDYAGVVHNAGEFLILVATHIGVPMMFFATDGTDPLDLLLAKLEAGEPLPFPVSAPDETGNPFQIAFIVIQVIRFIRELRNR